MKYNLPWNELSQDEKDLLKTWATTYAALWKNTPNIKEHLERERLSNPNNYHEWVLFIINIFKWIKRIIVKDRRA